MAFKKSTVNAAKVPSTLTDFPSYVDLSRIGITTLAQAQSLRTYSDEAKLVEQPREIVSATEGHVKIASLTSTSDLYGDYDGIRSDYATTATYGAQAVWSNDYAGVWHLSESSGNATDSTSNGNNLTDDNTVGSTTGQIDGARSLVRSNSERLSITDASQSGLDLSGSFTLQTWFKPYSFPVEQSIIGKYNTGAGQRSYELVVPNSSRIDLNVSKDGVGTSRNIQISYSLPSSTWSKIVAQYDVSTNRYYLYVNGSFVSSAAASLTIDSIYNGTASFALGARMNSTPSNHVDGDLDESRVIEAIRSANWITTEYNNQSDEASFWGDWEDVGGTPTPDYTLTAETGTFTVSGQATDFFTQYALSADPGVFTLSGNDATLAASRLLDASPASFTVAGSDAGLFRQYAVSAAPGAFAVAGSEANVLANYLLTGGTADLTLTGNQVGLLRQLRLPCDVGEFTLAGTTADFYRQLRLACVPGSFAVAGTAIPLLASYLLEADTGAYTLEGQNASLSVEYKVTAQTAGFTVSGPAAAILARYAMPLATGAFTIVGNDATIDVVAYIQPFCPMDSPFEDAASAFEGSFSSFIPFSEGECE